MAFKSTGVAWLVLFVAAPCLAADHAEGTVAFAGARATIHHAVLVRGPDVMDEERSVLRLYLSSDDIAGRVRACKTLSCADSALGDGAMVDFGDGPHLGYAVQLDGQMKQYSGGTDPAAFTLTTREPDHLVGKLHVDDAGVGGATIDADFDAPLVATFTVLH